MIRRRYVLCMVMCVLGLLLYGCGKDKKESQEYVIYYLNAEQTGLNPYEYEGEESDVELAIDELLAMLATAPDDLDYRSPIPTNVEVLQTRLHEDQLEVWFDSDYYNMDTAQEVLCRAAVVKTLTQIKDINSISFYVGDMPLVDAQESVVGTMTAEVFVDNNLEKKLDTAKTAEVILYYSSEDGERLVQETQKVEYSSNEPIEKVIIEQLMEGPKSVKGMATIPEGTKLLSTTTVDGVCYVNFDSGFNNHNYEIQESIVIYSIVNSLSELSSVSKVQISVNGSTKGKYRDTYKFETMYTRNLDYLNGVILKEETDE